ncbi:MAG: lipopolysaccharide core heptose(II) kinase RfaY [Bacteroidota bacterium]
MIYKHGNKRILVENELSETEAHEIVGLVESENFEIIEVLKDHPRSKVSRIRLNNLDLVLKIPREKNSKPWIRFLTLFRRSEAFKNLTGMKLLNSLGIKTTTSYLACEYRNWRMVTDSWLLYFFLDGKECLDREETFESVVSTLSNMHKKNILHGDPQIRNFLIAGEDPYVIDANPKKSKSTFAKALEYAYLKRSQPEIEHYFGDKISKSSIYKFAVKRDKFGRVLAKKKRAFKKLLKLSPK